MGNEFEDRKRAALAPIFFEAGAALYDCQAFEYSIAYLLFLLSRTGVAGIDPTRCTAILDDEEKKTAGQLVHMLRNHLSVSEAVETGLTEALRGRNRLIHRYLIENVERMIDDGEREDIVKEIKALRSTLQRSQKLLDPLVQALAVLIDKVSIDALATRAKEKFLLDASEY